jgi:hypothetical protein
VGELHMAGEWCPDERGTRVNLVGGDQRRANRGGRHRFVVSTTARVRVCHCVCGVALHLFSFFFHNTNHAFHIV